MKVRLLQWGSNAVGNFTPFITGNRGDRGEGIRGQGASIEYPQPHQLLLQRLVQGAQICSRFQEEDDHASLLNQMEFQRAFMPSDWRDFSPHKQQSLHPTCNKTPSCFGPFDHPIFCEEHSQFLAESCFNLRWVLRRNASIFTFQTPIHIHTVFCRNFVFLRWKYHALIC